MDTEERPGSCPATAQTPVRTWLSSSSRGTSVWLSLTVWVGSLTKIQLRVLTEPSNLKKTFENLLNSQYSSIVQYLFFGHSLARCLCSCVLFYICVYGHKIQSTCVDLPASSRVSILLNLLLLLSEHTRVKITICEHLLI